MKAAIENRQQIYHIMEQFYRRLLADPAISYLFTEVAKIDLEPHLQRITDFWEFALLGTVRYTGNVTEPHLHLNKMSKLSNEHFQIWLRNFNETIDEFHEGAKADEMKSRAYSMAVMMRAKMGLLDSTN